MTSGATGRLGSTRGATPANRAVRTVYLASPLGFSEPGRYFYAQVLIPAVERAGFRILDPWASAIAQELIGAQAIADTSERLDALRRINRRIGEENRDAIDAADAVLAILDGSEIDSGTASEVGYAAGRRKPVVGLRTDFRNVGDNEAASVNLQLLYFVQINGGDMASSVEEAVALLSSILSTDRAAATEIP